ncbi:MAG: Kazal-type serine protease inhibitor domain-containing protein [Candidatus Binatia bacterium]
MLLPIGPTATSQREARRQASAAVRRMTLALVTAAATASFCLLQPRLVAAQQTCGGIVGALCGAGEFCEFPPATCQWADQQGLCEPVPEACVMLFDPVCGCDGVVYGNDCVRRIAGVAKDHDGPCGETCGGIVGALCAEGEFCEYPPATCQGADLQGVCLPVPEVCIMVFDPVCGCDGATYGNDCERQIAGVAKDHDGPCGATCGGIVGAACPDGEFCEFPPNTCHWPDSQGTCQPIPQACITLHIAPECGCDGVTYSNDCWRRMAGVAKAHDGPCLPLCGDVNADADVNIIDALIVAQYSVGLRVCGISPFHYATNCDVNPPLSVGSDGSCNIADALRMAQCEVGLIPCDFDCWPFPCP